jgi:hypothetical protein
MIDFPRPKTGIARRCSLWPETVAALRDALTKRPEPKSEGDAGLFFVTKYGLSWYKDTPDSPLSKETAKLLKVLGVNGRRGLGFYTLRHTFRTVADEAKDQPAVDFIMGHVDASMGGHYRERIDDSRLRAVVEHVRTWLFGDEPEGGSGGDGGADGGSTEEGEPDRRSPESSPGSYGSSGAGEGGDRPVLRLFAG